MMGQWLKSIRFKLPIIENDLSIGLDNGEHVETVCLLSNRKCAGNGPKSELAPDLGECRGTAESVKGFLRKPDTHVDLTLDMEDYYRIKDQEKQSNK